MTLLEQSMVDFKERMKTTSYFSIAPLNVWMSLFTLNGEGFDGDIMRSFSFLFGLIASPILLLATPATIGLGVFALTAQVIFFPFQALYFAIQDEFVPLDKNNDQNFKPGGVQHNVPVNANDILLQGSEMSTHYSPLFSKKNRTEEAVTFEPSVSIKLF